MSNSSIEPNLWTFDLDYTESLFSDKTAKEKGFKRLTGSEIKERIINKTIYGDYPGGYQFVSVIHSDGTVEGINDVGSSDIGTWTIDLEKHTLRLKWKNIWLDTVTCAYEVNDTIEFYDTDTGNWRTTFKRFSELR